MGTFGVKRASDEKFCPSTVCNTPQIHLIGPVQDSTEEILTKQRVAMLAVLSAHYHPRKGDIATKYAKEWLIRSDVEFLGEHLVESLLWNFSSGYHSFINWGGGFGDVHYFVLIRTRWLRTMGAGFMPQISVMWMTHTPPYPYLHSTA